MTYGKKSTSLASLPSLREARAELSNHLCATNLREPDSPRFPIKKIRKGKRRIWSPVPCHSTLDCRYSAFRNPYSALVPPTIQPCCRLPAYPPHPLPSFPTGKPVAISTNCGPPITCAAYESKT